MSDPSQPKPDGPDDIQDRSGQCADIDAVKATAIKAVAAATASEPRLKALAGRLPGGDSNNYIPVLCDFLASEYGWGLDVIAGLDDRQMIAFVEQALRRRAQNRLEQELIIRTPAKTEPSEQLPPKGARFAEEDVPPEFREGGKPKGAVLTAPCLAGSTNWCLNGPYLTRHYGPGKVLTTHVKVRRAKAYLYTELLVLRDRKTANED
jgi:hypothetical protein